MVAAPEQRLPRRHLQVVADLGAAVAEQAILRQYGTHFRLEERTVLLGLRARGVRPDENEKSDRQCGDSQRQPPSGHRHTSSSRGRKEWTTGFANITEGSAFV